MSVFADVKAVVFDLDDTLCGYWDASKAALRKTFGSLELPNYTTDQIFRAWADAFLLFSPTLKQTEWYAQYLLVGEPTRTEQMRLALLKLGIDDPALARKLGDQYAAHRDEGLSLFPDGKAILDNLHGKYPLGLMTNGPADIQRQEINTLKIEHYFELFLIEGEMGEGKPNRAVFQRAEDFFGLEPHQLLMVGNSYSHDIRPAVEAGWRTAWIRRPSDLPPSAEFSGKGPEERPTDAPAPDLVLTDLLELPL